MGHRHSKWSVCSKQKKTSVPSITPPCSPDTPRSKDVSMFAMENNALMQTGLDGAQTIPPLTQGALPVQQNTEPIMEDADEPKPIEMGPSHMEASFLAASESEGGAMEEPESSVQMAEDPNENVEEIEMAKVTIWTIDDVDSETTIELEEHVQEDGMFKKKGHRKSKIYYSRERTSM